MKKPWSITTTLRNPYRLRAFLVVLNKLDGCRWDANNQEVYQILLIKNRVYGYGNPQFYKGFSQDMINLINDLSIDISFEQAKEIFNTKHYEDPAMRGRQSINALKKLGFVNTENDAIRITNLGELFLRDDFDLEKVFFKVFLKWQIPNRGYSNSDDYDIKPFVGTLHLINKVNEKETIRGNNPKGISKKEFSLFVPTLIHYDDIDSYANKIIALRDVIRAKPQQIPNEIFDEYKKQFASEFLDDSNVKNIDRLLKNLQDYGDNTIRYFRLTRYIYIHGGGFYIDLEPRRTIEINDLLTFDNAQSQLFESKKHYLDYISDISKPQLPWETQEKFINISQRLVEEIREYESTLQVENIVINNFETMQIDELKNFIADMRTYRQTLQDKEIHKKSQNPEIIQSYIEDLENIFDFKDRPILLEKLSALGLYALNDALKIKPNYPVGDDNEPTYTAPANVPDIECFYENFNSICEVTMLTTRAQWINEGQPVMRHLRDFEDEYTDKPSYCLFIAPKLHRDTINTFWNAIKYEYEGRPQKIIPLSIKNFVSILKVLLKITNQGYFLSHAEILRLYDDILNSSSSFNVSNEWIQSIPNTINSWKENIVS